jgi:endogenous inhibitor of DNA gyrase (YacG/DUF329 family)
MTVQCPKCGAVSGKVEATARLLLTVHCPFCGHDFGLAVDPPKQAELAPAATETLAPSAT